LIQLPATRKITKKFLRETMTMAQFKTADAHYREALRQILEQDVPDHQPPAQPSTEAPDAAAKAQLKAEVATWGLTIASEEVEYILNHYAATKARALLEGARRQRPQPTAAD
jgi:hypothetical protein